MLDKSSAIAAINELDNASFDNISNGLAAVALLPDDVEKLYVQHQTVIGRHLIRPWVPHLFFASIQPRNG
jgi:hypothetical protein